MQELYISFKPELVVRGAVTVDLYDNQLIVARRSYKLDQEQVGVLANILSSKAAFSIKTLGECLGLNEEECIKTVRALQDALSKMTIANEGGLDSAFEYTTICGDQLFAFKDDLIEFNHFLANNIGPDGYTTERVACQLAGLEVA